MSSAAQLAVCKRFSVAPVDALGLIAGAALSVQSDAFPIHGLRHPLTPGTCGWFIWAGEDEDSYSLADDFFKPVHVDHVVEWRPEIEPYISLPPGWRFLLAPGYEDVWFDESLIFDDTAGG